MTVPSDILISVYFHSSLAISDVSNDVVQDKYGNYGLPSSVYSFTGTVSCGFTFEFEYTVAGIWHTVFTQTPGACYGPAECAVTNEIHLASSSSGSNGTVLLFTLEFTNTGLQPIESISLRMDAPFGFSVSPERKLQSDGGGWYSCSFSRHLPPGKSDSSCGCLLTSYYFVDVDYISAFSFPNVFATCPSVQ